MGGDAVYTEAIEIFRSGVGLCRDTGEGPRGALSQAQSEGVEREQDCGAMLDEVPRRD